jgi:hypothetical protein
MQGRGCVGTVIISLTTKYVHIKSTTVYAPRRNWNSPNPFLASECSPSPRNRGRGHTSLRVGGWGESQFRRGAYTVVLFICTYFVSLTLPPAAAAAAVTRSRIHTLTISVIFLGVILRVLRLEVSVCIS